MATREAAAMTAQAADAGAGPPRASRISFIGSMCLLDNSSGIGHSIRSILEALARRGVSATSFTASLFDARAEVALDHRIGGLGEISEVGGGAVTHVSRAGVRHSVFRTESSRAHKLKRSESDRMYQACRAFLAAQRPDIVISYGTGSHARRLHDAVRSAGAQLVFYLGNAESEAGSWFRPGDRAICPSQFLSRHYSAMLGAPVDVLYPIVSPDRFVGDPALAICGKPQLRRLGFVTHLNPVPYKGLTLLIELVRRALQERKDMKFLILEGLMTREVLKRASIDLTSFPNVWMLPVQTDMAAVYARTAVLLMPSFWREGFGRGAVEAHLSGVPVLASSHGGLPEATGEAGLLDVPEQCIENPGLFPDDGTVSQWWKALCTLWDDPDAYAAASERAKQAGQRFHPSKTTEAVLDYFKRMIAGIR